MKQTCKRLPATASREERAAAHKSKMERRRRLQREGGTGFIPMPNARIDGAISGMAALAQMNGVDAQTAWADARANVARSLPAPRMGMYRLPKPSRSYRVEPAPKKPVRKPRAKKVAA